MLVAHPISATPYETILSVDCVLHLEFSSPWPDSSTQGSSEAYPAQMIRLPALMKLVCATPFHPCLSEAVDLRGAARNLLLRWGYWVRG